MDSPRRRSPALLLLPLVLLALSAPPALADYGRDPYTPVVLQPLTFVPTMSAPVADGNGGTYVAWSAQVSGNNDILLQHLTAKGAVTPGWPAGGLVVYAAATARSNPSLLSDGAGGVFIAWEDSRGASIDIYAMRLLANGSLAVGWPSSGLLVSTAGLSTTDPDNGIVMAPDGAGGAFILWTLTFTSADFDVYGAHVSSSGVLAWSAALYQPGGRQVPVKAIGDGAGGFYVAFTDDEAGAVTKGKVERFSSTGFSAWAPKAIGSGQQEEGIDIASDGGTGVYAVMADNGPVSYSNISGNHFLSTGANDPNWGGYRFFAAEANINQGSPFAAPDGTGGFIVTFFDMRYGTPDAFAQRIGPYGIPYSGWPSGGVALASAAVNQFPYAIVPDGSGGAIVVFADDRLYVDYFVYAVRVLGNGLIAPGWAYGGNPVDLGGTTANGMLSACSDGNGGAVAAWADTRGATSLGYVGIYAQNVDAWGQYGDARPFITRIADVPGDQGGEVSIQWTASYLDALPNRTVTQYSIWRRVPGGLSAVPGGGANGANAASAASGSATPRPSPAAAAAALADHREALRTTIESAQVIYWEYVETQPARMLPGYSVVLPTTGDSTGTANLRTSFMIDAESAGAQMFWASPPDSGYSVDNIAPYAPAPFVGTYSAGTASLHWSPVIVQDLDNCRLYRGTSASFVPGPSNHVASPVDTAFSDAAGSPYYYRLTAVDIHGNESASTLLLPTGALLDAGSGAPTALAFAPPAPNPARGSTVLRFALPREAVVRLAIYDLSGRRVRTLAEGAQPAGERAVSWDVRDDAGRPLGAGLYFARFEAEGRAFTQRIVAVR
jgi:hypothetical protein